jgi:hypothetical protein
MPGLSGQFKNVRFSNRPVWVKHLRLSTTVVGMLLARSCFSSEFTALVLFCLGVQIVWIDASELLGTITLQKAAMAMLPVGGVEHSFLLRHKTNAVHVK